MIQSDAAWYEAFKAWEQSCRGWKLWDFAVELEPPFRQIVSPPIQIRPIGDDGQVRGGIRGLLTRNTVSLNRATRSLSDRRSHPLINSTPKPTPSYRTTELVEMRIELPRDLDVTPVVSEQLLLSLGNFRQPIAFEVFADSHAISVQSVCDQNFARHLRNQWKAIFPGIFPTERNRFLRSQFIGDRPTVAADFGLARSVTLPLRTFRIFTPDPLAGLMSSAAILGDSEKAVFQLLFQPVRSVWAEEFFMIQTNEARRKLLQELEPNFLASLKNKLSSPLFAVSVRLMAQAEDRQRAWEIVRRIGGGLRQFSDPAGNELIALSNDNYPENDHRLSVLSRTTYRSGMLLNTSELAALCHLPSSSVKLEKLHRSVLKTKAPPSIALGNILILGENTHDGRTRSVTLSNEQRTRHTHVIGSTGSGKSTLLLQCIVQDIEAGNGVCVLDPHGDLIDAVCGMIPENRVNDVILFDPSDSEFPIGFNILQTHSDLEKTLISSDLVAAFKRMSTSWGDVMDAVLANAILALLEGDRVGTLLDLKRFLVEKNFRDEFLRSVRDESIRYFWQHEFPLIAGKPQASILIRLNAFLRQKLIRNIVCQKTSKINFREIMDTKKILLIKLSQGEIGLENSHFLGTLLISKIHQIALSRQQTTNRLFFAIYMDEFHNFIVPSMEAILSGIRKYNIALTLSHQEHRQLQSRSQEVAASVMSNCYTRICFRLGDADAERFAGGFSTFDASSLQNLGVGEAIARIERADYDFNLKTLPVAPPNEQPFQIRKQQIIEHSRRTYAASQIGAENTEKISVALDEHLHLPDETTTPDRPAQPEVSDPVNTLPKPNAGNTGKHHQDFQAVVKRIAESYGFRAEIEKPVLDGAGRVDVSLEKEGLRIACEVCVTTTDYEVTNVLKCLSAGYDFVSVLISNHKKIRLLESKIDSEISGEDREKVKVFGLTEMLGFLRELTIQQEQKGSPPVKPTGQRLNFAEACEFFGVTSSTLYRWVREGRVPFYRPGREYQFDRDELVLIGKHDLSGKRKVTVKLSPLSFEKRTPKSKKEQDSRYRKLLKLD